MKKPSIPRLIISLSPMVIAIAFSMDIYVPALPHLGVLFHASPRIMQLSLTLFMLASGLMQLIWGPISDQLGRKPTGWIAIGIFSVGCVLCTVANSAAALIVGRLVQATGASGMVVVGFSVVRDYYAGNQSARIYSYLNSMIAFSPLFAPSLGSFLDIHESWRMTFLVLLVLSVSAVIGYGIMTPESLAIKNRQPFELVPTARTYTLLLKSTLFSYYTLAICMGLSYLFLFCAISPYIILTDLHLPEAHYGLYFAFMGVSFFVGGLVGASLVTHIGIYKTVISGFVLSLLGGLLMTLWYLYNGLTINGFIYPMILIGMGGTFCMGAGSGGAMEAFPQHIGKAAALGGAARFIFACLLGNIVIGNQVSSPLPIAIPAILFSISGLIIFLFVAKETLDFNKKTG